MLKYKLVLAGAKNVGKSSLISRFCDNIFNENTKTTVGVAFKRKIFTFKENKKETPFDLNIWDFAGEDKYRLLFPSYAKGATAALILYDSTRPETVDDITDWIEIVQNNAEEGVIIAIIGNKIDLKESKKISREMAINLCKKQNLTVNLFETSAKTGKNVEEAFRSVVEEIIKKKLQRCGSCGDLFDIRLHFCNHCGEKV